MHLIIFSLGPQFRRVPLFRIEKVRVVDLLKFQIVRFFEERGTLVRGALAQFPAVFDRLFPFATLNIEFHHH